jgi:dTDP-4-dehydrorhamnose 3,5-epimerase
VSLERIVVTPMARIEVHGGDVLHALRASDAGFAGFGEAYFSWVNPGAVKGWKMHSRMTMNLVVPVGHVQVAFLREDRGQARAEVLGEHRYARLTVPPRVWFAFRSMSSAPSLLLNVANIEHDPAEVERLPLSAIDYHWPQP